MVVGKAAVDEAVQPDAPKTYWLKTDWIVADAVAAATAALG